MYLQSTIFLCIALLGLGHTGHVSGKVDTVPVAVRANAGEAQALQQWGATIEYLNQAVPGHQFVIQPYASITQQLKDANDKKFAFLLTNPATYVELEASHGAKAVLTLINNRNNTAQTRFGSVIFTHIDNTDILRLEDLRGKDFVAVNPLGFGGWRVGLKVLLDHGIQPDKDFASLSFAGKQPAAVEAVLAKKVHAGIVRTDMLERLSKEGKVNLRNVRILNQQHTEGFPFFHSTPLYPEWPFAVMPHAPPQLAEQVKQALLKLDKTHPAAQAGKYIGWTEALDYRPVKQLLTDLGIEPFADNKANTLFVYILPVVLILLIAFYVLNKYIRK